MRHAFSLGNYVFRVAIGLYRPTMWNYLTTTPWDLEFAMVRSHGLHIRAHLLAHSLLPVPLIISYVKSLV